MKQKLIITLSIILISFKINAQKVPIEAFAGDKSLNTQFIFSKQISPESKFGLFSLIVFNSPYDKNDKVFKYYNIQANATYNITKHFRVFVGTFSKNIDYGATAGLQYIKPSKKWFILIHNGNDLVEKFKSQLMGLVEYKPMLNAKWQLYTRVQVMQETDYKDFTRGFQSVRVGLGYKQFQFGVGTMFEQFGTLPIKYENRGVFIKADL
jgi:hypothetical protein